MASSFTHAAVALAFAGMSTRWHMPARFWIISVACSIVPDIDAVGFALGIPYDHLFGHRGVTHSLVFAFIASVAVLGFAFPEAARYSRKWWLLLWYFFAVTASHPCLDALTNGGLGVAFFAPFDLTRYFFPWRPLLVSPIGMDFFGSYGVSVLVNEVLWIWTPLIFVVAMAWWYQQQVRFRTPSGRTGQRPT
jgi:inner membrane protein